jgi:hypothetical protein
MLGCSGVNRLIRSDAFLLIPYPKLEEEDGILKAAEDK